MPPPPEDDRSSLERARERLYKPEAPTITRQPLPPVETKGLPHAWEESTVSLAQPKKSRHLRFASIFFTTALVFFVASLGIAGYIFLIGGNAVSVDKVSLSIQGPTTIAGGDTIPLSLTITNKNAVAIDHATIEITFPPGTRSATNVLEPYTRYTEDIGMLASGQSVTRTIRAVVFGGSGQSLTLPVSFSYSATGSNAVFVKKSSYPLVVSTTPLSVSVDALAEAVSGEPFTLTLTVRSNATTPLNNVVVSTTLPFGFTVTKSSQPMNNTSFLLGTLAPGAHKIVSLTGTITAQQGERRLFRFTVGTASTPQDQALAVTYMSVDAPVTITAPFINTTLVLNGESSPSLVVNAGSHQNAAVSYTNTLSTSITDATIAITLSGTAVDYNSIKARNGFYRSTDHTIVFSRDTDPALARLAPNESGVGSFSFSVLPASPSSGAPSITLTTAVSGTRVGQSNVPERVSASATRTIKVLTAVALSASALHSFGPLHSTGPIPPRAEQATTYAILWNVKNNGSAVAGGVVTAKLPTYVSYTGQTTGAGSFVYDDASRTVTWNTGDLAQGASAQAAFQVSFTPSTSQRGSSPQLTRSASFSGYDRFAGVLVSATADAVTTETKGDAGYVPTNASVQ